MPSSLVAGVDSSTQATKVVVVDADSGAVVASGTARHTVSGTGGARETDPREWWSALRTALAGDRQGRRRRRDRHRRPAARPGRPRRPRVAAPSGVAVERHARGRGRRAADESARGGDLGAADRAPAGRVVHGLQVGLAPADGARGRPGHGGDPAAARLPDRTADGARHDGSQRRVRDRLVVAVDGPLPRRDPVAPGGRPARSATCRRSSGRRRSPARSRRRRPPSSG